MRTNTKNNTLYRLKKNALVIATTFLLTACATTTTLEKHQNQANAGDVESQLVLADSYFFGTEDIPKDKEMGLKYYRLAAEAGSSEAAFNLGVIYQKDGLLDDSIYYYELASAENNASAQDNLAILYQNGIGVEKDLNKAEELYLSALSNGSTYSKRNLAILYRDSEQTDKAIHMFEVLSFDPTTKDNSYIFKKAVAFEIMALYLLKDDKDNAYVWGSVAVLSGLFDSNIANGKDKLARYESLTNQLTDKKKNTLISKVLENHFNAFQQYEPAIQKRKAFLLEEGLIDLPTSEQVNFVGYKVQINKSIYGSINFYKDKEDKKSRINFALHTLRLAAYKISVGAISPSFHQAKSSIESSLDILNDYDDSNLELLKENTTLKLMLVKAISDYQEQRMKQLKKDE